MAELAAAVLHGREVAGALGSRVGAEVVATIPEDHLAVAADLARRAPHVVGLAAAPWPTAAELHARGSAELPAYTGVVSWHALPSLADRLAEAAAPGVRAGAHLLVSAPDPGPEADPEDVVFLGEVAEALEARLTPRSRSIGWRGHERTPTAATTLRTVVEAHGHRDVVECPVAPGTSADPELLALAEELGARLTCVDLGRDTLVGLLAEVLETVAAHEGLS